MNKIKKLIVDPTDAYVAVGDSRVYMARMSDRKPVTNDTQVLSFRDLFLKIDELTEIINEMRGEK